MLSKALLLKSLLKCVEGQQQQQQQLIALVVLLLLFLAANWSGYHAMLCCAVDQRA